MVRKPKNEPTDNLSRLTPIKAGVNEQIVALAKAEDITMAEVLEKAIAA